MGTRLTLFDQKGGVGETTTVLNLGAALAKRGIAPLREELMTDQRDDFLEAQGIGGLRRLDGRRRHQRRLHHRRLHDEALEDLAMQVHLSKLPFGVGFVAAVDHEVLDDQAIPRTDAEAELRRIQ